MLTNRRTYTHAYIYNIEYTCHQIIIYVKLILAESVKKTISYVDS